MCINKECPFCCKQDIVNRQFHNPAQVRRNQVKLGELIEQFQEEDEQMSEEQLELHTTLAEELENLTRREGVSNRGAIGDHLNAARGLLVVLMNSDIKDLLLYPDIKPLDHILMAIDDELSEAQKQL